MAETRGKLGQIRACQFHWLSLEGSCLDPFALMEPLAIEICAAAATGSAREVSALHHQKLCIAEVSAGQCIPPLLLLAWPCHPMPPRKSAKAEQAVVPMIEHGKGDADGPPHECNAKLFIRINEAMNVVIQHPLFADIIEALPLAIRKGPESGTQAPCNKGACSTALEARGTYTCGGNIFWHTG